MSKLTDEQEKFLKNFRIPTEKAINGDGFSKSDCIALMNDFDYEIAYGVTPCEKAGHTLRWKSWHCAQCNTHNRIFQDRHKSEGVVYVAYTKSGGISKVGVCKNIHRRLQTLIQQNYGGYDDWLIYKKPVYCPYDAGKVEHLTQASLKNHSIRSEDFMDARMQISYELFACTPDKAYSELLKVFKLHGFKK